MLAPAIVAALATIAKAAPKTATSPRRSTPVFLGRELLRVAAGERMGGREVEPLADEATELAERTGSRLILRDLERLSF